MPSLTPEQLRAIHAKKLYEKNHDIIEALKAKHGNKNLQNMFDKSQYRERLDESADLIMKYAIDPQREYKMLTPIEMYDSNDPNPNNRNYVPSDGNWIQKYLYKGSGILTEMPPEKFLKLASPINENYNEESMEILRKNLGVTEGQVPQLNMVKLGNGKMVVVGHEGRHRATVAKEKGIEKIPVMMASDHSDNPLSNEEKTLIKKMMILKERS